MKSLKENIKNVIVFLVMLFEFFIILTCAYTVAENRAKYTAAVVIDTEDLNLTFKEDVSFDKRDEKITIPKGTVIKPQPIVIIDRIGFYYSTKGYSIEEYKGADYSERAEKGIYYLSAKPQNFQEYEELERLWNEASKQVGDIRTKVILKILIPVCILCLVWMLIWFFIFFRKKQSLLLLLDIILLPVFFLLFNLLLYVLGEL